MTLDSNVILNGIASHALASGYFDRVNRHEPANVPTTGLTAAVWVDRLSPVSAVSGLAATTARLAVFVRLFTGTASEPRDAIDPDMLAAVDALMVAFSGDFTLNDQAMNIDLLGAHGDPLTAQAGYVVQDGKHLRVYTITVPVIVSDLWTQAP